MVDERTGVSSGIIEQIEAAKEECGVYETLWGCHGKDVPTRKTWFSPKRKHPAWRVLFRSKDEAEAHACLKHDDWAWDGKPATPQILQAVLDRARRDGDFGVKVVGFKNGKWVILDTYLAGEPLPRKGGEE